MKVLFAKQNLLIAAGISIALFFTSCFLPQKPEGEKRARTVTVTGTGTVSVQADVATINFSVITVNRSVIEASRINSETVAAVRKALIDAGYSADSIVTDRYSIMQESSFRNGAQVRGDYRVANEIHIVLRNINNVGNVIDVAVKAGANQFSSIDFSVKDMDGALREARTNAIKQAYEAANLMVKTAGAELGQIISIQEMRGYGDIAMTQNSTVYYDTAEAATSVTPGKQKISVTVECTYEIQ